MKGRVLIVDDSLTVRMDLAQAFEADGFQAVPCRTGAQGAPARADPPQTVRG
jgi:two-component system, NtrC family, sensor kinase